MSQASRAPSHDERVIDRTALWQIWSRLTEVDRSVLMALATHNDYELAAASLNKTYRTFITQIQSARKRFLALWHEGEAPSRVWGRDRRKGHRFISVTAATIGQRRARARRNAAREAQG